MQEQRKAAISFVPLQSVQSVPEQQGGNSKSYGLNLGRPTVTSPQPLRALDRRPSSGPIPARNRSPSSSAGPFSDLAHQGVTIFRLLDT